MDEDITALFQEYEETTPEELIILIGEAVASRENILYSPQSLRVLGQKYVDDLLRKIRSAICPRADLANSDETELAIAIATTISQNIDISLAVLVGLYCSRRGIKWLCPDESSHGSRL